MKLNGKSVIRILWLLGLMLSSFFLVMSFIEKNFIPVFCTASSLVSVYFMAKGFKDRYGHKIWKKGGA